MGISSRARLATNLTISRQKQEQELKGATIIVVVDGMQNLMTSPEDGMNSASHFYGALTSIGNLAHSCAHYGAFLLPCCKATVVGPVEQGLKTL